MRYQFFLVLVLILSGCEAKKPTTVSGQPIDYWRQALKGKDVTLRLKAVDALGNVGPADPVAIPSLIDALEDSDARVRGQAALALLKSGRDAQDAIPALTRAQHDKDAKVRRYAAKALEQIQN